MLSDRTRDVLETIRANIAFARVFVDGLTFDAFASDQRTISVVTRALEVFSEASRRLPDDVKARYADVPWRAMGDAGNVYRHDYDQVADRLIWDKAQMQLDEIWTAVVTELEADVPARGGNIGQSDQID